MTTFDKREEGFEKKFAHDEELKFKASARRNKILGLWAAEKLGLSGAQAEAYAKEVVLADFEEPGDDDVLRKIRRDFDAKGINQSDQQIRRTMDELMAKAVAEVKKTGRAARQSCRYPPAPPNLEADPCQPPPSRSLAGCAQAKPCTADGAAWLVRSWLSSSGARDLRPSPWMRNTACGISHRW